MYEEKLRVPLGCLWVQIYTSTLALYGGLGNRMPQMTRLEAQFDYPEKRFRNVSIQTGKSKSPLLQEAIVSYIIIMYRCVTDPGYLILMAGYGCVSLARSNRPNCLLQDGKV